MTDKTKGKGTSETAKTKGKSGDAKGQAKLITLVNAAMGTTVEVSKDTFKANRSQYAAGGFVRQDDDDADDEVVPPAV